MSRIRPGRAWPKRWPRDPWAHRGDRAGGIGPARVLPLTDSCGFPLLPTPLAVKAEDYPLALPVLFLTPTRRLPLMTREFLDFLRTPAAQERDCRGWLCRPRRPLASR